ncbi:MAG: F0F1 ATP synthase subunit delta, partial [Planctomycetaceae bacterium]|nr:F0F1 ATP synthase subunit delta [Planctomycetaceae bacterium]
MIRVNDQEKVKAHIPSVMEDPSAISIAKVYAKAFLGTIQESDKDSAIEEVSEFLNAVTTQFPDFGQILASHSLNRDERLSLIDRVIAPHASELLTNFIRVLARHDRLDLLEQILSQVIKLRDTESGKKSVLVRSAFELSDETL